MCVQVVLVEAVCRLCAVVVRGPCAVLAVGDADNPARASDGVLRVGRDAIRAQSVCVACTHLAIRDARVDRSPPVYEEEVFGLCAPRHSRRIAVAAVLYTVQLARLR